MLKKLIHALFTIFGVSIVVFLLIRVAPGDPIAMMLPPGATEDDVLKIRALYGFDKSIFQQYIIWFQGVLVGDWGTSITFRVPVLDLVLERLPATLELSIFALFLAVIFGGSLAILATFYRDTKIENGIDIIKSFLLSIPDFLWALFFVLVFSVFIGGVFPSSGRIDQGLNTDFATNFYLFESLLTFQWAIYWDLIMHIFLPALALSLPLCAIIAHVFKHSIFELINEDFVVLARVKGFSFTRILFYDILKNAAIPSITLIAVQFTFLIGGTVIIEKLFAFPGIGNLAIDAVINRDLPLIQGVVICFSFLFVFINAFVDISYYWLNPRLKTVEK